MVCAHTRRTPPGSPASAQPNRASVIAACADRALLAELLLTPKPGLVDRRNSGAHRDMDMSTFLASARAIAPWWRAFVDIGYAGASTPPHAFLPRVRPAGVLCEQAMLGATSGVNTHKGAIFSLGLLCAAAGRLLAHDAALTRERLCTEVAEVCIGLVKQELTSTRTTHTAGERVFERYGLAGARGEAASGYATVRMVALPVYDRLRRDGARYDQTLMQVLLSLLAVNADTNVLSRGGVAGLHYVRAYARRLLAEGGVLAPDGLKKMEAFDEALIARHLSPGGSADLLAVTWFLAQFPTSHDGMEAR